MGRGGGRPRSEGAGVLPEARQPGQDVRGVGVGENQVGEESVPRWVHVGRRCRCPRQGGGKAPARALSGSPGHLALWPLQRRGVCKQASKHNWFSSPLPNVLGGLLTLNGVEPFRCECNGLGLGLTKPLLGCCGCKGRRGRGGGLEVTWG